MFGFIFFFKVCKMALSLLLILSLHSDYSVVFFLLVVGVSGHTMLLCFFFFKQKTAYEIQR